MQPVPLPLINGTTIIEQPTALNTLCSRYVTAVEEFIHSSVASGDPFYIYMSFNHVRDEGASCPYPAIPTCDNDTCAHTPMMYACGPISSCLLSPMQVHGPNSCGPSFCGKSVRGPVGDAIEEMDWAIGQIMAAISAAGVDDNTLVFFTSDNGAPLGGDAMGNLPLRDGKASGWEGGFREPGMVRWPGKILPGRVTDAIASTMDIFPTMMSLAGVPLPKRIIDGMDLSPVLFDNSPTAHDCIMFYRSAAASNASTELASVRCGDYKAYWLTHSTRRQPWPDGPQHPPLLFNVATDHGESTPIDPTSALYKSTMSTLTAAREAHLATITPVPNQNGRGSDPNYKFCADPHSKDKYPHLPNCTLSPDNWRPSSICASPACVARYDHNKLCKQAPSVCPGPKCPPVPATNEVGCYVGHSSSGGCDLKIIISGHCRGTKVHGPPDMSAELCNALCAGYAYFGLQNGGTGCFCGDKYGTLGPAPPSWCNISCVGNRSETCGGLNINSVYKTVVSTDE